MLFLVNTFVKFTVCYIKYEHVCGLDMVVYCTKVYSTLFGLQQIVVTSYNCMLC